MEQRLEREKEKEQRRFKLESSKFEDKKSEMLKEHNLKLKEAKKE